jgi:23S rRNA (guanosine2251-2'-O)-methyltransferase
MSNKSPQKSVGRQGRKSARGRREPRQPANEPGPARSKAGPRTGPADIWLYGIHAVRAALANPRRQILHFMATGDALTRLGNAVESESADLTNKISGVEKVSRSAIDAVLGDDKVHQGLALKVTPLPSVDIADVLDDLTDTGSALVVALDQVTDPHNVGAVLRSAAAFGACAVLTTRHNAPDETGVLAKSASGALESTPLLRVTNLSRALKTCQDRGFWIVGLDADAEANLDQMDLSERCVLVLGAEGEGVRRGVLQNCDFMAKLPMSNAMESLNVSNAAAISMYEWRRQRR